ncbi:MAG: threonine ammonia-lyase, partial [Blastocatellia bacterium]
MSNTFTISIDDIESARRSIGKYVKKTPLMKSATLSEMFGSNIYLKVEAFQKTGSFKVRGAFNKMLTLTPDQRKAGAVAVSGGNHAQAVAYAARILDIRARILMPQNTPKNYVEATKEYGGDVVLTRDVFEAFAKVDEHVAEGWSNVHPFNDPLVMSGQGTLGLEILEELPQMTDIVVSIGGGGLIGGVSTAIKSLRPDVRIWGVETDGAHCMSLAMKAGHLVEMPKITSIAKTLGAPSASKETLALAKANLESVTVVSDIEALEALQLILERTKILVEPAASCTLSAAGRLRDKFDSKSHVVLLLCGGNVGPADL